MFPFINKTWNPFTGPCVFNCSYCWAKDYAKRFNWGKKYLKDAYGIDEKQINRKFKPADFVFVQDMSDVSTAHYESVIRVMDRIKTFEKTNFLFLTKDPSCYLEWIKNDATFPPRNTVLGATIETTDATLIEKYSRAPHPYERLKALNEINDKGFTTFVSIEPIMDFRREVFLPSLEIIRPWAVAVGYDNYDNGLIEPSLEKTMNLIESLEKRRINVYKKTLREANDKNA